MEVLLFHAETGIPGWIFAVAPVPWGQNTSEMQGKSCEHHPGGMHIRNFLRNRSKKKQISRKEICQFKRNGLFREKM
jgi:hypothetical protein